MLRTLQRRGPLARPLRAIWLPMSRYTCHASLGTAAPCCGVTTHFAAPPCCIGSRTCVVALICYVVASLCVVASLPLACPQGHSSIPFRDRKFRWTSYTSQTYLICTEGRTQQCGRALCQPTSPFRLSVLHANNSSPILIARSSKKQWCVGNSKVQQD